MKIKWLGIAAIGILMLAAGSATLASTCTTASTTSCSIDLTVTNGFAPSGTVYGTVTLTLNGNGTISVDVATAANYGLHNAVFGFNLASGVVLSNATVNSYTFAGSNPGTPSFGAGGQMDGFGMFTKEFTGGTGSSSDYTDLKFTLSGHDGNSSTGFTAVSDFIKGNGTGASNFFAGQIAFLPTGCTGWVGNAGSANGGGATQCVGTPVPEPGTLTLFGGGLLALGGLIRRKMSL
jgi:hypothetical protein